MSFDCSKERPWGIHPVVYNDEECPRCGWTAPGPVGDAQEALLEAKARVEVLGWQVLDGGPDEALAA